MTEERSDLSLSVGDLLEISREIVDIAAAADLAHLEAMIEREVTGLKSAVGRFDQPLDLIQWGIGSIPPPLFEDLVVLIDELGSAVSSTAGLQELDKLDFDGAAERIRDHAAELSRVVSSAWETYYRHVQIPDVEGVQFPGAASVTAERCLVRIRRMRSPRRLPTPEDAEKFHEAVRELSGLVERYRDALPPDVERFLESASSADGAGLGELTDDVKTWLRDTDRWDGFRIFPKR